MLQQLSLPKNREVLLRQSVGHRKSVKPVNSGSRLFSFMGKLAIRLEREIDPFASLPLNILGPAAKKGRLAMIPGEAKPKDWHPKKFRARL